jgi:hypothetical protein
VGIAAWVLLFVIAVGIGVTIALARPATSRSRRTEASDTGSRAAAGWYPDPTRRSDQRYWDGNRWTDDVMTGGQRSRSPLTRGIGRLGGARLIPGPPSRPRPPGRP